MIVNIIGLNKLYQGPDDTERAVQFEQDTVWLTQAHIAEPFGKDVQTVNEHIIAVLNSGELEQESTIRKFRIVRQEGRRVVARNIDPCNLDMIISVGYRVNSYQGSQFRIWATKRLKDCLVQGFAINQSRLAQKELQVQHLKTGLQILSRAIEDKAIELGYDWLLHYAKGLELLVDCDNENLDKAGISKLEA